MGTLSNILLWFPGLTMFLIGAGFTPLAWHVRRWGGRAGLLGLGIACAVAVGAVWGQLVCAQGMTCDGGGSATYYLVQGTAIYGFTWLCAFGLIALLVAWRGRRDPAGAPRLRHLLAGGAAAVLGMVAAAGILASLSEITCGMHTVVAADGTLASACDF